MLILLNFKQKDTEKAVLCAGTHHAKRKKSQSMTGSCMLAPFRNRSGREEKMRKTSQATFAADASGMPAKQAGARGRVNRKVRPSTLQTVQEI